VLPASLNEPSKISVVGQSKLAHHGDEFLGVIEEAANQ